MYVINASNVNEALPKAIRLLQEDSRTVAPRGQNTLEYPTPVATVYQNPTERVMLWEQRDANPFFHLFESIWILQGRQDVPWLAQFNSNIANYSDNGYRFHAPYGYRLRSSPVTSTKLGVNVNCVPSYFDQISIAVSMLKKDKDTRQVVLQIWNCLLDLDCSSKDVPCNDLIFLKIRDNKLHMRVCCRSNDVIWGAYGANAVQFSMLLEYMASMIGVEVGTYTQISDSFHVYTGNPQWELLKDMPYSDYNPYRYDVEPYPIMSKPMEWDNDAAKFMERSDPNLMSAHTWVYRNAWFNDVVAPMYRCWKYHKKYKNGLQHAHNIKASDWRMAVEQWLTRRE